MKKGDKLRNGAEVIMAERDVLLCKWYRDYVTWYYTPDGEAYWGNYFPFSQPGAYENALKDFERRLNRPE